MIDKIGFNKVGFTSDSNLLRQLQAKPVTQEPQPQEKVTLDGTEALANYNKPSVQPPLTDITKEIMDKIANNPNLQPATQTVLDKDFLANLKGEEIKNSEGKLIAIIVKGEKTSKEYKANNNGEIYSILERDNQTKLPIRKDSIHIDGEYANSFLVYDYNLNGEKIKETSFTKKERSRVSEFNPKTNLEIGQVSFYNDKIFSYNENDNEKGLIKEYYFDENQKPLGRNEFDNVGNTYKKTRYSEGKVESSIDIEYPPVQSKSTIELKDINIEPSPSRSFTDDELKQDGDKKLYSNGQIEQLIVKKENLTTKYNFDYDGKFNYAEEFLNDKKVRTFGIHEDGKTTAAISEYNADERDVKSSYFRSDGTIESVYDKASEKCLKRILYSFDGKYINEYEEADLETDDLLLNMRFNKAGNIIYLSDGRR